MSADNGIYILVTEGPEYRVAHCQAIDNIYGTVGDDGKWTGDAEMVHSYFDAAPVFSTQKEALAKAYEWAQDAIFLEYGIGVIDIFKNKKYQDIM